MIVSRTGSSRVETGAKNALSWLAPVGAIVGGAPIVCCVCCCWMPCGLAHWGPPIPTFIGCAIASLVLAFIALLVSLVLFRTVDRES
jgi:hypothetical protein